MVNLPSLFDTRGLLERISSFFYITWSDLQDSNITILQEECDKVERVIEACQGLLRPG